MTLQMVCSEDSWAHAEDSSMVSAGCVLWSPTYCCQLNHWAKCYVPLFHLPHASIHGSAVRAKKLQAYTHTCIIILFILKLPLKLKWKASAWVPKGKENVSCWLTSRAVHGPQIPYKTLLLFKLSPESWEGNIALPPFQRGKKKKTHKN